MSELARTGRQQQRYEDGYRLIAGCIPFKYRNLEDGDSSPEKVVEVLMINSTSGSGLLFPKDFLLLLKILVGIIYHFNSKHSNRMCATVMSSSSATLDCVAKLEFKIAPLYLLCTFPLSHVPVDLFSRVDGRMMRQLRRQQKGKPWKRLEYEHYLGCYPFKSKTLQDECSPEGLCRAAMYALHVKEELKSWPEKSHRERCWMSIPQATRCCRHVWMREALEEGFSKWYAGGMISTLPSKESPNSSSD